MLPKSKRRRAGATVVEMALTLPVLFVVLFSSYELARANMLRHAARAAAYEGARVGILPGTNANSVKSAARFVLGTIGVRGATIDVVPANIQSRTPTVRVEVKITAKSNFFFAPFFFRDAQFVGDCELSREVM